jgi:XTP/dITP diphosphohydrolase
MAEGSLTGAKSLLAAVAVMDRLRSPGGCPWDAEQTHLTLAPYLLEETYETLEAIDEGDSAHLREELGDLLLQVLFHARLAEELPASERFTIDDVAADLVAKLVRRHPHVFADTDAADAEAVAANWEEIKQAEKQRTSVLDGVPLALPALARATKMAHRIERSGLGVPPPSEDGFGSKLVALASEAARAGVDPEQALRQTLDAWQRAVRAAEATPATAPES